jgi:hypothetical protein
MSEPKTRPRRRLLGKAYSISERVRTYWTDEALEVDEVDHYEIRRRRVFFDEILLVTLHTKRGGMIAWVPGLLAIFTGLMALAAFFSEPTVGRVFAIITLALLALMVLALLIPNWVVTVFGKRTRGRMFFQLRQNKAREVYAAICRAASEAQRALALRLAAESPPPEPLPPLPLSDSELPPVPEEPPPLDEAAAPAPPAEPDASD